MNKTSTQHVPHLVNSENLLVVFYPNITYNSYYVFVVIVVNYIVDINFIVYEDVFVLVGLNIYAFLILLIRDLIMAFLGGIGFGLGGMVVFALLCLGLCCVRVILGCLMQVYFL